MNDEDAAERKKKLIKWGIIGGGIAALAILGIVLGVVLSKSSKDEPIKPPPPPPGPFYGVVYNPYAYESLEDHEDEIVGTLIAKEPYSGQKHLSAWQSLTSGLSEKLTNHNMTTTPKHFPEGPNNKFIDKLKYRFTMSDYNIGILEITDANNKRWSIPEYAVKKEKQDTTMRTEMLGLNIT